MATGMTFADRLRARKPVEFLQRESRTSGLTRTLGPLQLVLLGIGCIVGAGHYLGYGLRRWNPGHASPVLASEIVP
jgi:basic amino acid/polyamine antiporter, APA family